MKETISAGLTGIMINSAFLGILSFEDIKRKKVGLIPIALLAASNAAICICMGRELTEVALGILPGIFAILVSLCTKGKLGLGDGLVLVATGLVCDWEEVLGFWLIALVLSSLLGIVLMMLKKAGLKTALPFLPFLLVGFLLMKTLERLAP